MKMALIHKLHVISKFVFPSPISKSWVRNPQVTKTFFPVRTETTTSAAPSSDRKEVKVTFLRASGERIEAKGKVGDSLLDIVVNNEIDLDGYGACEGTLTCSTCHVIFSEKDYNALPDKPNEEEMDMLDLAFELSDTSRLGCQVIMSEKLDGIVVKLPATINDIRAN